MLRNGTTRRWEVALHPTQNESRLRLVLAIMRNRAQSVKAAGFERWKAEGCYR
jgi:hypothetical protein